jgi:hypothetical protein
MYRHANIFHLSARVTILIIVGSATRPKDFDRLASYGLTDTEKTASDLCRSGCDGRRAGGGRSFIRFRSLL